MIKKELLKVINFAKNIKKIYITIRNNHYWTPTVVPIDNTLELITGAQLAITCSFNAETLTSIWENGFFAVTLWNKYDNKGYQLVGLPVKIDILSINPLPEDLSLSRSEESEAQPAGQANGPNEYLSVRVERRIYFNVEEIIEFDNNAEAFPGVDLDELREEIEEESLINY